MNILGIHYGHNATVCLMQHGRVVFCQSEERFLRIKNVVGFPGATLNYVYRHLVSPEQIHRAVLFQKSVAGYRSLRGFGFKPVPGGHYLDYFCDVKEREWKDFHERVSDWEVAKYLSLF